MKYSDMYLLATKALNDDYEAMIVDRYLLA